MSNLFVSIRQPLTSSDMSIVLTCVIITINMISNSIIIITMIMCLLLLFLRLLLREGHRDVEELQAVGLRGPDGPGLALR